MNVQYQRHLTLGIAVTVALTVVLLLRHYMPEPPVVIGTVPTGASFNLVIARFASAQDVGIVVADVQAAGLPAFTRTMRNGSRQVIVGPYVSIDEAEEVQRLLARRGFDHAQMLVDESIRRTPGIEAVSLHVPAPGEPVDPSVVVVAAAGRLSMVLEMPTEPRQVVTRRATGSVIEVDAGPIADPVSYQEWNAPDGVELINQVSIGQGSDGLVRTRVLTPALTHSNVRVVGRRVYIDFWANSRRDRPLPARAHEPVVEEDEDEEERPAGNTQAEYRDAMSPIVARVDEIEPFLISAVESPAPEVLAAISKTLRSVQEWIGTIDAPNGSASTHTALVEAINLVTEAADPAFAGDRARQARQALARFHAASANSQLPTPNSQLPTPNSQRPTPN